jgi:hypothetical protein
MKWVKSGTSIVIFVLLLATVARESLKSNVDANPPVLYTIDSYFVSPDDPRKGHPFKVPVDLIPEEKKWAGLVAQSNRELDSSPYNWGPVWPEDDAESLLNHPNEVPNPRSKHGLWPNPAYKSNLDKQVSISIKKTMDEADEELRSAQKRMRLPVKNWMEG